MAECRKCHAEVAVYDHSCPKCGADVRGNEVRPGTDRRQARLCHLIALPGMVICFVPLNMVIPLLYKNNNPGSRTIRSHVVEVMNFQLLWTVLMALLLVVALTVGPVLWPFVWFGGIIMVLFNAYEAGNGGDGKYLLRIPVFK